MQIGIAAYFRNVAVRINQIGRQAENVQTQKALADISSELAEKAEIIENSFQISPTHAAAFNGKVEGDIVW